MVDRCGDETGFQGHHQLSNKSWFAQQHDPPNRLSGNNFLVTMTANQQLAHQYVGNWFLPAPERGEA